MENIEFGVKFQLLIFQGHDKADYNSIHQQSLFVNRKNIYSICVRTWYKDMSSDVFYDNYYKDCYITESLVLISKFHTLLLFKLKNNVWLPPNTKAPQVTIDLLSSDDKNSKHIATSVGGDVLDNASCQDGDSDNSITKNSVVNELHLLGAIFDAVYHGFIICKLILIISVIILSLNFSQKIR